MIKLYDGGVYIKDGVVLDPSDPYIKENREEAMKNTIAYGILKSHNISDDMNSLRLRFDAMASHDITYVGIIQTARASGMKKFPLPYVLTNCHNSLCAVGGTINDDDHLFGLSAAKKYGGIYVPPNLSVIHQYMRENFAGCGKMILGSDSHTRYGALGTMAIGEGGGELVKQLLLDTYDISYPEVIAVNLRGKAPDFVGPQDIALSIIGKVFKIGYVKNKIMEFIGPGVSTMSQDFRNSVDVMTTEAGSLSSIWRTDEETRKFLNIHGREEDYIELNHGSEVYYDGLIDIDLSKIKPMMAFPFHPSNTYSIEEFYKSPEKILREVEEKALELSDGRAKINLLDKLKNGKLHVEQGIIAGCAGGNYTNIMAASQIMKNRSIGNGEFYLSIYPSSQPVYMDLDRKGILYEYMESGAVIKPAFCGPCFGAGDTPGNNVLSIRHTTRNFPNREGSKPDKGQMSAVILMDARSIAATAINGGVLTSAEEYKEYFHEIPDYKYNESSYKNRVYNGFGKANTDLNLRFGPNIKDWPSMEELSDKLLIRVCSKILDEVTTTDELIPSGETSSYRSNPEGLSQFTLARRDPLYLERAKYVRKMEKLRLEGENPISYDESLLKAFNIISKIEGKDISYKDVEIGSLIYANKPGDGSAREQAASCQRVLGAIANIAISYATKRYRSNCINWGIIPLQTREVPDFKIGDYIYLPSIREDICINPKNIKGYILSEEGYKEIDLYIAPMTETEKEIIKSGSLINYNRNKKNL